MDRESDLTGLNGAPCVRILLAVTVSHNAVEAAHCIARVIPKNKEVSAMLDAFEHFLDYLCVSLVVWVEKGYIKHFLDMYKLNSTAANVVYLSLPLTCQACRILFNNLVVILEV